MSDSRLERFLSDMPENLPESSNVEDSIVSEEYLKFYNSIGDEIERQRKESRSKLEKAMNVTFGSN